MKTLYLDLGMGAAGDMLTAALLELIPDPDAFVEKLYRAGIPGVRIERERSVKCGITGTHVRVTVNGEEEGVGHDHHHNPEHGHHGSPDEIAHIVESHIDVPEKVKKDIIAVYGLIAEAESFVHGVPVTDIHFHEVGTMDALADVTAVCLLMDEISPDETVASPVCTGFGKVACAHGILPVPAPATAYLLRGIPAYGGRIEGELCTPTGAALLKHFVARFGESPVIRAEKIGYGMGTKDFPAANCVRATLGETAGSEDSVFELSFNVDDMTAEQIGFAAEALFAAGARDVYTVPTGMKKNRPGTLISAICDADHRDAVVAAAFRRTSTLGVREAALKRYILDRETERIETRYGTIRRKKSCGYGVSRFKYEYEDVARVARDQGVSLAEAEEMIARDAERDT